MDTAKPGLRDRATTTPASVWLCAPGPLEPDPDIPRWASALIAEYSCPGQLVEVRTTAVYSGVAGDIAALLHASITGDRDAVAVLPDAQLAGRTRELLEVFPTPGPSTRSGRTGTGHRARVVADHHDPAVTGSVGLAVVLAGPVRPAATTPLQHPAGDYLLARAARALAPGAALVLLCPPQTTSDPTSTGRGVQRLIDATAGAGLRYTQHLVLVHVPVADDAFVSPDSPVSAGGPFHPIHTDAFVFTAPSPTRSCP